MTFGAGWLAVHLLTSRAPIERYGPSAPQAHIVRIEPAREAAAIPITLYTTSWCGVCNRARYWLERRGLAYVERDAGTGPVPTLDVDGQILIGFSPAAIESALEAAARRRP